MDFALALAGDRIPFRPQRRQRLNYDVPTSYYLLVTIVRFLLFCFCYSLYDRGGLPVLFRYSFSRLLLL